LQRVEAGMGRRRLVRWGGRIIDLDLLLHSDVILNDYSLRLPHASINARVFVLLPLLELAPEARSPRTGVPYRHYASRIPPGGWRIVARLQRARRDAWVLQAA
jgi:7,8-dihydro-6-hydroxymethylpterin-pyrophosphokinase